MRGFLKNIVEYFRQISKQHYKLKGFLSCELYELNSINKVYPLLAIQYPIDIKPNFDFSEFKVSFKISVYTNIIEDFNGNEIVVSEDSISKDVQGVLNEIDYIGLSKSDELINNSLNYLLDILTKFRFDYSQTDMVFGDCSIKTSARVFNDDLFGATATIILTVPNTYICEIDTTFPNV